jgi:putative oxidoreductase
MTMAAGLLMLRVVVGVALVGHGTQKLFGWFGGLGPRRTGAFFERMGYRPGHVFAVIAGLSEAGAGVLLVLGFLTPLADAAVVGVMLNAAWALRERGPWAANGGWEYPVVLATVGATLALTGPGTASADQLLGLDWSMPLGAGRRHARDCRSDHDAAAPARVARAQAQAVHGEPVGEAA